MSRAALLHLAREYVRNVPPESNSFASRPSILRRDPWEARTLCSTLQVLLVKQAARWTDSQVRGKLGRVSPYAEDLHQAILVGKALTPVHTIQGVQPGDLIAIKYDEDTKAEVGFTGHAALVEGEPRRLGPVYVRGKTYARWAVWVIDSTGSPHGGSDSRALSRVNGIGRGELALVCEESGFIVGYSWSVTAAAELNSQGKRDVQVGAWVFG